MSWTGSKKKKRKSKNGGDSDAFAAIEPNNRKISKKRQCELLGVKRHRIYRKPRGKRVSAEELRLRAIIDLEHTQEPTWGYRKMTDRLRNAYGYIINTKRVRRIMRDMGIYAIYPKPNSSKLGHAKYVMPYLLRRKNITHANHVWGVDITYIPMEKGFMYLFVIIDWYSRYIVDYELSSTLHKEFVMRCMNRALKRCKPEIINSDQGSHFTNPDYIGLLKEHGVKISMDGKGRCLDNAKTERFFRSLKYDRIYVYEINSPTELRKIIKEYMIVYNTERPHAALDGRTPESYYMEQTEGAA